MHFYSYPTLGSTSDHAKHLINQGINVPFAVHAFSQEKGRGQNGRTWLSPEGGLYLTMVLEPPSAESITLAPLKVALILSKWFIKIVGKTVTIKWPNDILVSGRKLAGILCESCVQSNSWGPLVVGIGVNIESVPELENSVSLRQIANINWPIEALASDLASYINKQWISFNTDFRDPMLNPKGWLWWNEKLGFFHHRGITRSGQLRLSQRLNDEQELIVTSNAQYDLRWIYQSDCSHKFPLITLRKDKFGFHGGYFIDCRQENSSTNFFSEDEPIEEIAIKLRECLTGLATIDLWPLFCSGDPLEADEQTSLIKCGLNPIKVDTLTTLEAIRDAAIGSLT